MAQETAIPVELTAAQEEDVVVVPVEALGLAQPDKVIPVDRVQGILVALQPVAEEEVLEVQVIPHLLKQVEMEAME